MLEHERASKRAYRLRLWRLLRRAEVSATGMVTIAGASTLYLNANGKKDAR
jgi:hypothetical protein